jgi:hypothetical protein
MRASRRFAGTVGYHRLFAHSSACCFGHSHVVHSAGSSRFGFCIGLIRAPMLSVLTSHGFVRYLPKHSGGVGSQSSASSNCQFLLHGFTCRSAGVRKVPLAPPPGIGCSGRSPFSSRVSGYADSSRFREHLQADFASDRPASICVPARLSGSDC